MKYGPNWNYTVLELKVYGLLPKNFTAFKSKRSSEIESILPYKEKYGSFGGKYTVFENLWVIWSKCVKYTVLKLTPKNLNKFLKTWRTILEE